MFWCCRVIIAVALLIVHYPNLVTGEQGGRAWYVSFRARRQDFGCGTQTSPCRKLEYVIIVAGDDDVIHIEAHPAHTADYTINIGDGSVTTLNKNLHLVGYNGVPRILLTSDGAIDDIHSFGSGIRRRRRQLETCHVTLECLSLEEGLISFGGCSANISQVTFVNSGIKEFNNLLAVNILIERSEFHGKPACPSGGLCGSSIISNITCHDINLTIQDSKFYNTMMKVSAIDGHRSEIKVTNSLFGNKEQHVRSMGGLNLILSTNHSDVTVRNCTFENLLHPTIVKSATNLYEAGLLVRNSRVERRNNLTSAILFVDHSVFYNNERGFSILGSWNNVTINDCTFEQNIAVHAGAGILQLTEKSTRVSVVGCRFSSNQAGSLRAHDTHDTPDTVQVENKEVHIDHDCCKGVLAMVGRGGAIRVQRGKMDIINCTFTNNTAHLMGGSVMVDMDGQVEIRDSRFQNSPDLLLSEQGDILYSRGKVLMSGVVFDVQSTTNGVSLVKHHGNHWSMDLTNIFFQCPVGFNVRATNSTAHGITSVGLRRSHKLDDLTYSCQYCPHHQDNQDRGYLNYTITHKTFAHYVIKIDGTRPNASMSEGDIDHHLIDCTSGVVIHEQPATLTTVSTLIMYSLLKKL